MSSAGRPPSRAVLTISGNSDSVGENSVASRISSPAVKAALAWRGVPVTGAVRAPLLPLDASQRASLEARLEELTA